LGAVVPSSNTAVEAEFGEVAPEGVTVHAGRMRLDAVTAAALDAMADDAERAARLLGDAAVDAVAYACTTGSLLHGPGFDAELEAALADAAGAPAVATARSVDRALEALSVERVAVATPYVADLNEREREYLDALGYDPVVVDGRGLDENTAIGALDAGDAYRQARAVAADADVDAVFVSCTNYRTLSAIPALEADLGVPVVTSNQATLWDLLGVAGVDADGPGSLFDN
ncbi:MAG: maleate cis-trans isomerase, partial [Halorubrum sp.]